MYYWAMMSRRIYYFAEDLDNEMYDILWMTKFSLALNKITVKLFVWVKFTNDSVLIEEFIFLQILQRDNHSAWFLWCSDEIFSEKIS